MKNRFPYLMTSLALALSWIAWHPAPVSAQLGIPHFCVGCDLQNVDLHGRDLRGVKWVGVSLSGADLRKVNFSGSKLVGVSFRGALLCDPQPGYHGCRNRICKALDASTLRDVAHANLDGVKGP